MPIIAFFCLFSLGFMGICDERVKICDEKVDKSRQIKLVVDLACNLVN